MKKNTIRFSLCVFTLVASSLAQGQTIFVADSGGSVGLYNGSGSSLSGFGVTGMVNGLYDIGVADGYLYALSANAGILGKYTTSGATVNAALISGLSSPQTVVPYGGNLYVSSYGQYGASFGIAIYDTAGGVVNGPFITGLSQPSGMAFDAGILYVVNFAAVGSVAKYDAATGALLNASFITGLNYPHYIAISDNAIYVTDGRNSGAGGIGKYDLLTGATINATFVTGFSNTADIAIYGNQLFSLNPAPGDGTLKVYDATTGALLNGALLTGMGSSYALVVVPEPSTYALLLGAATLLGTTACRRIWRRSPAKPGPESGS